MTAAGWSYFTPYVDDVEDALRSLRNRVFDRAFPPGSPDRPKSIAAYMRSCGDDGTYSILDILRADTLGATGEMDDHATAFPLFREEAAELFGARKPTREDIQRARKKLMTMRPAGQATWVVVHDAKGNPVEYVFTGVTGY
ncbi:MAG: hypothetical protein JWP97_6496 [Labilithrix sp.]|nr:hypothetical protein [Labilithrix sp.]